MIHNSMSRIGKLKLFQKINLSSGPIKKRFGFLALEKGYVTIEQIVEAMTIQTRENVEKRIYRPIGDILLELGYIETSQIKDVLDSKFEKRFGEIAVSQGYIDIEQLIIAVTNQVKDEFESGKRKLLGEILINTGVLNHDQVDKILDDMKKTDLD